MIFTEEVTFTSVDFVRNKEGVYVHKGQPLHIRFGKIESFGDGRIDLDNGNTMLVEEDAETIAKKIREKREEKDKYEGWLRDNERAGTTLPDDEEEA
jgi:uncharacterized protein YlzI (FlbEa/FlbD family)